jgi:multidrug efflux pump subunit AcrA (membrane-fusion protein)
MSATLTMVYRRSSALGDPILIPPSATVSAEDGQSKVWVVDDDGKVSSRSVKLGRSVGGQIEVLSGLEAGERVATAGVSFLREGMIVRDLGDALSDTAAPAGISASQPSDVEATKP